MNLQCERCGISVRQPIHINQTEVDDRQDWETSHECEWYTVCPDCYRLYQYKGEN